MALDIFGGLSITSANTGSAAGSLTPVFTGSSDLVLEADPLDRTSFQFKIPKAKITGATEDKIMYYVSGSGKIGVGTTDPQDDFDIKADTIKFRSEDGKRELEFREGRLIPKKFANSTDVEVSGSELIMAYSPGTFTSTSVARSGDILGTLSWEDLSIARKGDATALRIQGKVDAVANDGSAIKGSMRFGIGNSIAGEPIVESLVLQLGVATLDGALILTGSGNTIQIGDNTSDADRKISFGNTTTAKNYVMGVDNSRGKFVIHQGTTAFPGSSEDFAMDNSGNIDLARNLTVGGNIQAFTLGGKLTGGSNEIEGSNFDITGGSISGCNITVGAEKTLDLRAGTLTLADNQISGDKVEGGTIASTTVTQLFSTNISASAHVSASAIVSSNTLIISASTSTLVDTPTMGIGAFTQAEDTVSAVLHVSASLPAVEGVVPTLLVEGSDGTDYLTVGPGGHITASANISASGEIYSDNQEILFIGSFKYGALSDGFYGLPGNQGVLANTWGFAKTNGPTGLGATSQHIGVRIPYKCVLVGMMGNIRAANTSATVKMSVWTAELTDNADNTWTKSFETSAITTAADANKVKGYSDLTGTAVLNAGTSWIPAVLNDTGGSSDIFGSYTIVIKRIE